MPIRKGNQAMISQTTTTYSAATPSRLPEAALRVTGMARLVLVINLGSFVHPSDADEFRHRRGSEAFAEALRGLHPSAPFGADDDTRTVERDAYTLRIFRSRLMHNHFFPTYKIAWDSSMRERMLRLGCTDIGHWQRWAGRIRLSRNGLAVITLDQAFENISLVACTEQILELPAHGEQPLAHDQWSIAMSILEAFLDAIGRTIALPGDDAPRAIRFATPQQLPHTVRLDRYVVYAFRKIERDGRLVAPHELKRDYAPMLASFMESTLVECDGERRFAHHAEQPAHALMQRDASSWEEELCLLTGESALLYYPLIGRGLAYVGGELGLDARAYGAYWAGIMRGIEHLVAFRAEAQQAERRTTALLGQVPGLTRKINDGHLSADDLMLLDHLAAGLSDIFDSLPELRSMAVSTTAFRADFARRKFDALLRELAIGETLDLVNTNVEQLNFFLSYYNDMRLQWQGMRTNNLGIVLGVIVLFMAVSSFLADTFSVVDRLSDPQQDGWVILAWVLTFAGGLLILGLALARARKQLTRLTTWRWRRAEARSVRPADHDEKI
ncbi:MAG TPA: hypothetical protein PLO33_02440 [Kouleothrix sp.]|nr:hypothetical protein [Kouleothrix sp.]HRC74505.1 hypothetical protein [Kouleothrix sp.]